MVNGLRNTKTDVNATSQLGRLNMTRRATGLVRDAAGMAKQGAEAAGTAVDAEEDLTDTAAGGQKRALRAAGNSARQQLGKKGVARATAKAGIASTDTAAGGQKRALRAAGNSARQQLGKKGVARATAKAGIASGASRQLTGPKVGGAVRGGLVAAAKRRTGATAAKQGGKATAAAAARSTQQAIKTTKRAVQSATFAARAISALISSVSSAPALIAAIVIAGVLAIVLSFIAFIPGIGQATQSAGGVAGAFPMGDDYPFKGTGYTTMNPNSGYYYGNCTDFVWWRVNRDAGVSADAVQAGNAKYKWAQLTPNGGNGGQWANAGNLPGWTDTRNPVAGDIISIHHAGTLGASSADPGHVGYVAAVDDSGAVTIENYGNAQYFVTKTTVEQIDSYIDSGWVGVKHNPRGRIGGEADGDANGDAQTYAQQQLNDPLQFSCLVNLWNGESGWNPRAENASSGAYGIPQALPGNKMLSAGSDWQTNPITQVKWGLGYIKDRYGSPCNAWSQWQSRSPHWY